MSTLLICQIVLTIAAFVGLGLIRRAALPASLFWAIGIGLVAAAALLGIFAFAGVDATRPAHLFFSRLAAGVGLLALLLASLFAFLLRVGGSLALFVTALGVALLIAVGGGAIPTFGLGVPTIAAAGMVIVALLSMRRRPRAASWLLAAVGAIVLAELARQGLLRPVPVQPINLYHLLLALGMLGFGQAARTA